MASSASSRVPDPDFDPRARPLTLAPPAPARSPEATAPVAPSPLASSQPFWGGPIAGILAGNAMTLAGAVFQHWPALPVMLIYWGQSVAIGVANVIRMMMLKEFSTEGLTSNDRPVPANRAGQVSTARFFAFHYGFFHLGYALFLLRGGLGPLLGWTGVAVAINIAMFAGSHVHHVLETGGQDYRKKPNLGTLMFYPYLRIIPMHLAIILGATSPQSMLPLFIVLKTGADLGMHEFERRIFRGVS
jgi:hypothetical protein